MGPIDIDKFLYKQNIWYCPKTELYHFKLLTENKVKSANAAIIYLRKTHNFNLPTILRILLMTAVHRKLR